MSQDQDTLKYFNEKMKFMRFLDHARWCNHSFLNYELPNMADKKAPSEQVLLTHFLGYITNRQTPFQTVFEQLDYIFSQMVHNFAKGESVDDLLNPCKDKSFFVQKEGKDTYTFVSHEAKSEDSSCPEITKGLMRKPGDRIYAVSRFYPNDYIAIRCVMEILDEGIHGHPFNRGLIDFIKWAIGDKPAENGLERLLYALWLLGYQGIGSWAATKPDKEKHDGKTSKGYLSDFFGESESDSFNLFRELKNKKKEYLEDMGKNGLNDAFYKKNFARAEKSEDIKDNERFSAKRVICFVRDMFKLNSNAFSTYLKKELGEGDFKTLYDQIPDVLELPGDIWNNNDTFQECLAEGMKTQDKPNIFVRKQYILCRELYGDSGRDKVGCYPEQFDCTFNFVPRMCEVGERMNCEFCPIRAINKAQEEQVEPKFEIDERFCHHHTQDKFCPFLLFAVGFKVKCKDMGDECPNYRRVKANT